MFLYKDAYQWVTGVEGISEAVHAALLKDGNSNKFIAGREQEECDCCQHTDLIHVRPGLIYRNTQTSMDITYEIYSNVNLFLSTEELEVTVKRVIECLLTWL